MTKSDDWRDVMEIGAVIARIAHAMDAAPSVTELTDLLTPGIRWSFAENPWTRAPASTLSGTDAVERWAVSRRASKNQGPRSGTKHVVSNVVVERDGEYSARSRSYFCFYRIAAGAPVLTTVGGYDDEFARVDGSWLLAARLIRV